jgi:hypothetical protein
MALNDVEVKCRLYGLCVYREYAYIDTKHFIGSMICLS